MGSITLNNKKRIVCPFCAEKIRVNDMLFAGEKRDILMDPVLSNYYLENAKDISLDMKSRELICWRALAQENIIVEGDFVIGVTTNSKRLIKERACSKCHNVIPELFFDKSFTSIFGPNELVAQWIAEMQEKGYAGSHKIHSLLEQKFYRLQDNFGVIIELSEEMNEVKRKRELFRMNSQSYIFVLELDALQKNERCIDENAAVFLNAVLNSLFHVQMLYKPSLFVLYTSDEIKSQELIEDLHRTFLNYLNSICQVDYEVIFWSQKDNNKEKMIQNKMKKIFQK